MYRYMYTCVLEGFQSQLSHSLVYLIALLTCYRPYEMQKKCAVRCASVYVFMAFRAMQVNEEYTVAHIMMFWP